MYSPLLSGKLGEFGKKPDKRLCIKINRVDATVPPEINWSSPKGAEPKLYEFSHVFKDFLSTGNDIELNFLFYCGLTRLFPGKAEGAESDYGIDVYGNGRLIQQFLKYPFGWGTPGISTKDQASNFIRGQLFINGHSFAIPWDTHKREYLSDHPVAQWLYDKLRPIVRAYKTAALGFTGDTELRKTVLATTAPPRGVKPEVISLPPAGEDLQQVLPKLDKSNNAKKRAGDVGKGSGELTEQHEETRAHVAEVINGERVITISLSPAEYEDLIKRFAANSSEELEAIIRECLIGGVAFTLTPEQLVRALQVFKCDGDVGELSEVVRTQLLKKIQK